MAIVTLAWLELLVPRGDEQLFVMSTNGLLQSFGLTGLHLTSDTCRFWSEILAALAVELRIESFSLILSYSCRISCSSLKSESTAPHPQPHYEYELSNVTCGIIFASRS